LSGIPDNGKPKFSYIFGTHLMEVPRNIVGPQIMRIRSAKGWSQEQMATACQVAGWDVSRGVIARIEGGVRWVADFELIKIAEILQVKLRELYPESATGCF
jgi:transcriptional regulator with XRE-family HTH domain